MTQRQGEGGASAAARLLALEAMVARITHGSDLFISGAIGELLACLHGPLLGATDRAGLVIVPDISHGLCRAARARDLPVNATVVTPDASEEERRALGISLHNRTVQLIIVTPERLSQARFVEFIRKLALVYVAVASSQCLVPEAPGYRSSYARCHALRELFPGLPLLALVDEPEHVRFQSDIAQVLGLQLAQATPKKTQQPGADAASLGRVTQAPSAKPGPASPAGAVTTHVSSQRILVPDAHRAAFSWFETETPIHRVMTELQREEGWVWQALVSFIRVSERTHPFPWVPKPVYLSVSMAAGQAESTSPRLIASVLKGQVDEGPLMAVLAALENRGQPG